MNPLLLAQLLPLLQGQQQPQQQGQASPGGPLGLLGGVTSLAAPISDIFGGFQRLQDARRNARGPLPSEIAARNAAAQAGGLARSTPGLAPAAAARESGRTLADVSGRLAPQMARERESREQQLAGAHREAFGGLTRGLGAIGGGLSSMGALGATSQPQGGGFKLAGLLGMLGGGAKGPAQGQANAIQPQESGVLSGLMGQPAGQMPGAGAISPEAPMPAPPMASFNPQATQAAMGGGAKPLDAPFQGVTQGGQSSQLDQLMGAPVSNGQALPPGIEQLLRQLGLR